MSLGTEYTGITSVLGGANKWACQGGSRLILYDTSGKGGGSYQNFDLSTFTKQSPLTISFTADLSEVGCGAVFAVYFVPMESPPGVPDADGALYNDAQAAGFYIENEPTPTINGRIGGRCEIDLFEASANSVQTTPHGYGKLSDINKLPMKATGTKCPCKDRWGSGAGLDHKKYTQVDQDGIWANANVDESTGKYTQKVGPGLTGTNQINTNNPVSVTCKVYVKLADSNLVNDNDFNKISEAGGAPVVAPFYTITQETILTQGTNIVKLNADTVKPPQNQRNPPIQTYFPAAELKQMKLCYSFWAQGKPLTTNWLDGDDNGSKGEYGVKRGECTDYSTIQTIQDHISKQEKDTNCKTDKAISTNISNVHISSVSGKNAWVLDYQYRGINDPTSAVSNLVKNKYNPKNTQFWAGRYNYSYLNCQNDPSQMSRRGVRTLPQIMFNDPDPDPNNAACNVVFGEKGVNIRQNPNTCAWSGKEPCQYLDTHITTIPGPPGPPPPSYSYNCDSSMICRKQSNTKGSFSTRSDCEKKCVSGPGPKTYNCTDSYKCEIAGAGGKSLADCKKYCVSGPNEQVSDHSTTSTILAIISIVLVSLIFIYYLYTLIK